MRHKSQELMEEISRFAGLYYLENGKSPSTTVIAKHAGIARGTAYKYLVAMAEKGMISYDGRNIITPMTEKYDPAVTTAEKVGSIRCGTPEEEEAAVEEYVTLPTSIFGVGPFYLLKAKGDSMDLAGIGEGDLLVIEKPRKAELHDIVAALDQDGANTLKRLEYNPGRQRNYLRAESSNKENRDIYPDRITIQGVARYVIKAL